MHFASALPFKAVRLERLFTGRYYIPNAKRLAVPSMQMPTGACHMKNTECEGSVQQIDREKNECIRTHKRPTFRRLTGDASECSCK